MRRFLELGDRYAAQSDWKDFALTKFCLCAMGVLIGTEVSKEKKAGVQLAAAAVFAATYIPLMKKVYHIMGEMREENLDEK